MPPVTAGSERLPLTARWILNRRLDLALFVGTPLLIIPVFFAVNRRWSSVDLFLIVSTFGALGHHAPGLMRAYGDRELFRRFWLRFTLAPLLALGLFSVFTLEQLPGVMLVLLSWGLWHFLMQTYGFARIYDAKTGTFDETTRRLDLAICISWSGMCVLHAPERIKELLTLAVKSGVTLPQSLSLENLRAGWTIGTVVVSLLFVGHTLRRLYQRQPVNIAKLLLFTTTFSFFWFCVVTVPNLLLGIAMFEIFHDVQYLGIVWLFNRNRVDRDPEVGAFSRFLFRPGFVGMYVGLVLAYGFIGFAAEQLTSASLRHLLFAVIAASNVLHFYYDGFIWKIRDRKTSVALNVGSGVSSPRLPGWVGHLSKWCVLFAVIGALLLMEQTSSRTDLERATAVADYLPNSVRAQNDLAKALLDHQRYDEVIQVCRDTSRLGGDQFKTSGYLGVALTATGHHDTGTRQLQEAVRLNPDDGWLRFHLAMGFVRQRKFEIARTELERSVKLLPDDSAGHFNLGILNLQLGMPEAAVRSLKRAIALRPDNRAAHQSLAQAQLVLADRSERPQILTTEGPRP